MGQLANFTLNLFISTLTIEKDMEHGRRIIVILTGALVIQKDLRDGLNHFPFVLPFRIHIIM